MTKHTSIAISGRDLIDRLFSDTDEPWREVIDWDSDELDALEALQRQQDSIEGVDWNVIEGIVLRIEEREMQAVREKWWVVSWPEFVTTPRYNSDATYHEVSEKSTAVEQADEVYGEIA